LRQDQDRVTGARGAAADPAEALSLAALRGLAGDRLRRRLHRAERPRLSLALPPRPPADRGPTLGKATRGAGLRSPRRRVSGQPARPEDRRGSEQAAADRGGGGIVHGGPPGGGADRPTGKLSVLS